MSGKKPNFNKKPTKKGGNFDKFVKKPVKKDDDDFFERKRFQRDGDNRFSKSSRPPKRDRNPYVRDNSENGEGGFERKPRFDRDSFEGRKPFSDRKSSRPPRFVESNGRSAKKPLTYSPRRDSTPYNRDNSENNEENNRFERKPRFDRDNFDEKRPSRTGEQNGRSARPPFNRSSNPSSKRDRTPFIRDNSENNEENNRFERKPRFNRDNFDEKRPSRTGEQGERSARPPFNRSANPSSKRDRTPYIRDNSENSEEDNRFDRDNFEDRKPSNDRKNENSKPGHSSSTNQDDDEMRLNKYIAHCGICSRRKAAELVANGQVTVNGEVVREVGYKVLPNDVVTYHGNVVKPTENMVYLLMNKPKDTITTVTDDRGRKTIMDLVERKIPERVYPVGRLDRDTVGLLLLTNDGELAEKLSHPSYMVRKIYHAVLNKPLTKAHLEKIQKGVELEDGVAEVDSVNYVEGAGKEEVGIEIHIGKNRVVRRIFEELGYEVVKLDRVIYAGLTKKDLPRGHFRHLTPQEIIMLRHFTNSKTAKKKKKPE